MVYASDRNGDGDIFIADADGQNYTLITSDDGGAEDRLPVFNPVGQMLVFTSNRDGDAFQLYTSDLRGNGITRLADPGLDVQSLAFKPELLLVGR